MKRIVQYIILLLTAVTASAQSVTFFSPEFEEGVKRYLNIEPSAAVTQQQTDTITEIDLSGFGIKDIRDVAYLPNVRTLDLSFNEIRDVAPLLLLDSLHNIDLRNNQLEDISELAFANTDSMEVNVAYNYITDFSRFYLPSNCDIRIAGMSAQKSKNVSYMDVYLFFADIVNDQPMIKYRGYSNMEGQTMLDCGDTHVSAVLNGSYKTVKVSGEMASTTKATLSNGDKSSETYVVPPKVYVVNAGDEVTINTALPESYQIGYLRTLHGTVEAEPKGDGSQGATLHYTAPSPLVADTLYMSYYEGNRIKGFAQMYFMSQDFYDGVKSLRQDNPMKMSLHDGVLSISGMSAQEKGITAVKVFDAMGRTLAMQTTKNQQSIEIPLPSSQTLVIVEVTYAGQRIVTKVAAR